MSQLWKNMKKKSKKKGGLIYNLSKEGLKEYDEFFVETHDKAHGLGKYSKKRKKKKRKR